MFKLFIKLQAKIKKLFMSPAEKECYLQVKTRMGQFTQRHPLPMGVGIEERDGKIMGDSFYLTSSGELCKYSDLPTNIEIKEGSES